MLGLDVTESPESDAMVDAPAEAPVRTGPEIAGDGDVAESSEGDAMVDAPADRLACFPGAARKKPKKDADRELDTKPQTPRDISKKYKIQNRAAGVHCTDTKVLVFLLKY